MKNSDTALTADFIYFSRESSRTTKRSVKAIGWGPFDFFLCPSRPLADTDTDYNLHKEVRNFGIFAASSR